MKADIDMNNGRPVLTLTPENDSDKKKIGEFEETLRNYHSVQSRGLGYLDPEASFYFWRGTDER